VAVAAALVLIGLGSWGLWRVLSGSENLPFAQDASPPASSHVTKDHTYSLAVPGGVEAMLAAGVPTANSGSKIGLQCHWSPSAGETRSLEVDAESISTKATNTVGHFVSPITGRFHVDCDGWGAMFIPDADDRPSDTSGWALVIAIVALTAGAGLGLSGLRTAWDRSRSAREDDEVEGFVDYARARGDDREVGGDDTSDVRR
jgi:hypothetical protein